MTTTAEPAGETTISERAIRRIAAEAAREVPGVGGRAHVDAAVSGDHTVLDVRLPVRYPEPVGQVTDACREHLIRRTEELTGLYVSRVDIVVAALVRPSSSTRRVQ